MNNNWVPSGRRNSLPLLGCPHYFNEKNINGSKYKIVFDNDMGHLMIKSYDLFPEQIRNFAYEKIKNKINYATDNKNLGCQFYILKNGLNNTWDYNFNNATITLDYSQLDKFNPKTMKWC
jgi:hypothetical protein